MEDQQPSVRERFRPWVAAALSVVAHVVIVIVIAVGGADPAPASGGDDAFAVDVEIAPEVPEAERMAEEQAAAVPEDVVPIPVATVPEVKEPEPEPEPEVKEPEPEPTQKAQEPEEQLDAGVADGPTEPEDEQVATVNDGGVEAGDGGIEVAEVSDAGPTDDLPAASPGTSANLLTSFPKGHSVTVLIRFDRLRDTEWAEVAQTVVSVMPDYTTLVADESMVIADNFDLLAVSTPKASDVASTLVAVKARMTQPELRDYLDAAGAHVNWSRVTGGVKGERLPGKRVQKGDPRVFLAPYGAWMVLAQPSDLPGMLDPADGDLDGAEADPAAMPRWLAELPELEDKSGAKDGPALMMTLEPRSKTWKLPELGLDVTEVPPPKRMTLSLELETQGFVARGHLLFADEATATTFVERVEAARTAVLDAPTYKIMLKKLKVLNAVKGLDLAQNGRIVSYSTSLSIADARVLFGAGMLMVGEYFEDRKQRKAKPAPEEPPAAETDAGP